jgi:hypothetical protein
MAFSSLPAFNNRRMPARAALPQVDRSGHVMTGVGHELVTLAYHADLWNVLSV